MIYKDNYGEYNFDERDLREALADEKQWPYELVDVQTNKVCYKEQSFFKWNAPDSKPFELDNGELVQWFPMLP